VQPLQWQMKLWQKKSWSCAEAGTAAKVCELYKRIVHGNEVITSIVRDFPDKLSQEVVAMSMALMSRQ
jgi:hypothetical protein